jgi:hypothetical protein
MKYKVYSRFGLGWPIDGAFSERFDQPETVEKWGCLFWVGTDSGDFVAGCRDLYDAELIVKALNTKEV